ncbi:MAG: S53 family peptidase, partial [Terriglobales bacterium]
ALAAAQGPRPHNSFRVPSSSAEHASDLGRLAHTNVLVMQAPDELAARGQGRVPAQVGPPVAGLFFETPASIACLYQLAPLVPGCNPNVVSVNPAGGTGTIAIVDAFDDPLAERDLRTFDAQFGLQPARLRVVFASGRRPAQDPTGGWELEESLDIEWAHAMAPGARIVLVEAASNSFTDLFSAVAVADELLRDGNGGELSMSWGGSEFSQETLFDVFFTTRKVIYFAATGDAPGVIYPSTSPLVVAAGGSSTNRDPFTGAFEIEGAWQSSGGGPSAFELTPPYQQAVAAGLGLVTRATPDLAFDSDPNTGVYVFDSSPVDGLPAGWFVVGGTSVASPSLAGIVNAAHSGASSSVAELAIIYAGLGTSNFRDLAYANCGPYGGFPAAPGWDFCTGVGSVLGLSGK